MKIYIKTLSKDTDNYLRFVTKIENNKTTNLKDAIIYSLKKHYRQIKIGDIIIEKAKNSHSFDFFCYTTISYEGYVDKNKKMSVNDGNTIKEIPYKSLSKGLITEPLRIEIKTDKTKNTKLQIFKNKLFNIWIRLFY